MNQERDTMNVRKAVISFAGRQHEDAVDRYTKRFDSATYASAVKGKNYEQRVELLDSAMALVGNPYFKFTQCERTRQELEFLRLFIW